MSQHHEDFNPDSPYGVICPFHGKQGLDRANYELQMSIPDKEWICPVEGCGRASQFDDIRLEIFEFNEVTEHTPDYPDSYYTRLYNEEDIDDVSNNFDYPWEYGADE